MWTMTTMDDDGRTTDHCYTISSPGEPSAQVSQKYESFNGISNMSIHVFLLAFQFLSLIEEVLAFNLPAINRSIAPINERASGGLTQGNLTICKIWSLIAYPSQ